MARISFGSYHAADTPVHALDTRVKLLLLMLSTWLMFAAQPVAGLGTCAVVLLVLLRMSRTGLTSVLQALRPASILIVLLLLGNGCTWGPAADIHLIGSCGITVSGFVRGLVAAARLVVMVGFVLVICATTTATAIADALTWALSPLARFGLNIDAVGLIFSSTLRFIPLCVNQFEQTYAAQRARGINFSEGSLLQRLKRWTSVMIPVVVALFRHADAVGCAMRERGYGMGPRTSLRPTMSRRDIAVMLVTVGVFVLLMCVG